MACPCTKQFQRSSGVKAFYECTGALGQLPGAQGTASPHCPSTGVMLREPSSRLSGASTIWCSHGKTATRHKWQPLAGGQSTVVCRPAHALYFATYEVAKQALGVQRSNHAPLSTAAAGAMATVVNDALMTPGDVVKQRLQLANSPYSGMMDCIVKTYRYEGLSAFFRSYKLTARPLRCSRFIAKGYYYACCIVLVVLQPRVCCSALSTWAPESVSIQCACLFLLQLPPVLTSCADQNLQLHEVKDTRTISCLKGTLKCSHVCSC